MRTVLGVRDRGAQGVNRPEVSDQIEEVVHLHVQTHPIPHVKSRLQLGRYVNLYRLEQLRNGRDPHMVENLDRLLFPIDRSAINVQFLNKLIHINVAMCIPYPYIYVVARKHNHPTS